MTQPDALVVGAGPAGSVAALVLARAGVRVRLVDRARFPRDKLCGDTLNPGSLSILDRLGRPEGRPVNGGGIGERVRDRALPITGMLVTGPGGATVASDYPNNLCGAAIARRDLDLILLEAAIEAGAEFHPGVAVGAPVTTSNDARLTGVRITGRAQRDLGARIVIAADGRHSTLAFALGLVRYARAPRRWAFGAYFAGVDGLTSRGEMHIRPGGYIGVAPLPGDVTNVCVVQERRTARSADRLSAEEVIASAIAGDPALTRRFARARQVSPVRSLGPLAVDARATGCPGLLLAGDAAGFVDPMTGDGLRFALRGGELAAEAALRELESGAPAFGSLGRARAREFAGKWRVNRALRSLVASPRGVELAARLAARWSAPVRVLIGVAGDVHLARSLEAARH